MANGGSAEADRLLVQINAATVGHLLGATGSLFTMTLQIVNSDDGHGVHLRVVWEQGALLRAEGPYFRLSIRSTRIKQ